MELDRRDIQLLSLLRHQGPLSRRELHQRMGLRPNTVGDLAERLLVAGLLREGEPRIDGPGRPSVPLEIDPGRRRVVGLALEPGEVSLTQLNLHGTRIGPIVARKAEGAATVAAAVELLQSIDHDPLLAIGVSVTGFADAQRQVLLQSSVAPQGEPVDLHPIKQAASKRRVVLENDLQALAAQWLLTHEAESHEDILLVFVRDGAVGAAVLIGGRPNRGCVMGGNELGHTRLLIETDRCFCGHTGCLERVFSTDYLHRTGDDRTLAQAVAAFDGRDRNLRQMVDYLSMGVTNAINLIRPNRVVLASEFNRHPSFTNHLISAIRRGLLRALADHVRFDLWDRSVADFAEAAGWLALASLYRVEWLTAPSLDAAEPARSNGHRPLDEARSAAEAVAAASQEAP